MKKSLRRFFYLSFVAAFVVFGAVQIVSLAKGYKRIFSGEDEAVAETIPTPTPKYPYKSCVGEKETEYEGEFTPDRIVIDSVGIDLQVVPVPLVNGTWRVNAGVANYAEGTSLVNGVRGNVGIFAHDRKNGFTDIKKLTNSDEIYVYGATDTLLKATYSVEYADVFAPTDVAVYDETEDPVLTLVTCDGSFSQKRFIVRAKLVKFEELNCNEETI